VILIAHGKQRLLRGARNIADHDIFYPPHMILLLFLLGMPGQFLFGVTTRTMSAVVRRPCSAALLAATALLFYDPISDFRIRG